MKQRKENSNDTTRPNWHFRFRAARLNYSLLCRFFFPFPFLFFILFFFLKLVFSVHAYHTARLASLTWNEKWKAWHSFSLTKATGTLALPSFFPAPRTSRPVKDFEGMCAWLYRGLSPIWSLQSEPREGALRQHEGEFFASLPAWFQ